MRTRFLLLIETCLLSLPACMAPSYDYLGEGLFAVVSSSHGEFVIRLAYDKAPLTVANFVGLAVGTIPNKVRQEGEPYFDGLTFHRVDPGFVIQGGDPLANGRGGPGYFFRQEIHPDLSHDVTGTVAMAHAGSGTNGSQWYITLRPAPELDGGYNVFGYVVEGMPVVHELEIGDAIQSVRIVRNGEEAKQFKARETWDELR